MVGVWSAISLEKDRLRKHGKSSMSLQDWREKRPNNKNAFSFYDFSDVTNTLEACGSNRIAHRGGIAPFGPRGCRSRAIADSVGPRFAMRPHLARAVGSNSSQHWTPHRPCIQGCQNGCGPKRGDLKMPLSTKVPLESPWEYPDFYKSRVFFFLTFFFKALLPWKLHETCWKCLDKPWFKNDGIFTWRVAFQGFFRPYFCSISWFLPKLFLAPLFL